MVQRLSCDEVRLSTFTEPSLMKDLVKLGLKISLTALDEADFSISKRFEQLDGCSSDRCNDEEEDHHANWTVLVRIVDGCLEKSVTRDSLTKTVGFF